ncbi:hypothetical protein [Pelomonas sp. SE-A7]|uniref:hypothetical protein n=1 Tax=Pelomonas sp. SE-A7 TaxID=3054953 RepID=UPI00259C7450|nr:hypothetical protein [Pelomonas sp. SE-A7]MDM4767282.1 hypothetical protein [Pelomonas sp. SE-A7]
MEPITLTLLASDPTGCAGGKCPTLYRGSDGHIYVQGFVVEDALKASVSVPNGEELVRIPEALINAVRNS